MAQKLGPNMTASEELTLSPGELANYSLYSNKGVVQGVCICMHTHVPVHMYVHAYMHEHVHVSDALYWLPRVLYKCVQRTRDN